MDLVDNLNLFTRSKTIKLNEFSGTFADRALAGGIAVLLLIHNQLRFRQVPRYFIR